MKIKILMAVMAMCAVCWMPLQAQDEVETRHEISLSYGVSSNSQWISDMCEIVPDVFGEKSKNEKYFGPIGLEYYYRTSPLMAVGVVATLAVYNDDRYIDDKISSSVSRNYFSLMPSLKLNWLRKEHWGLYSKVAAGITYGHSSKDNYENGVKTGEKTTSSDLFFNFQASAIGIEAGGNHVRGFAELGIGEQGIALAGVRYKF